MAIFVSRPALFVFIQFMFTVKLVLTVEKRIDYNEENIILDRNLYMYGRCGFGSHARGWAVFICLKIRQCNTKTAQYRKGLFFKRFLDYFNDANKDKNHKKFDLVLLADHYYSTDTKLGLGLVAAGLYRADEK